MSNLSQTLSFMHGQLLSTPPPPPSTLDLSSATILVTGANSGLGYHAALQLVRLRCHTVVLVCRSLDKAEKAKRDIGAHCGTGSGSESESSSGSSRIVPMAVDIGDFKSLPAFTDELRQKVQRLDGLLLNAGVDLHTFSSTEGYETTIAVNVVGTFVLASLLLPQLRESVARTGGIKGEGEDGKVLGLGRVGVVGSAVHLWADEKELTGLVGKKEGVLRALSVKETAKMKNGARYNLSKLCVMLLVRYLGGLLMESNIRGKAEGRKGELVINNIAPGLCQTALFRDDKMAARLSKIMGRKPELGARTLLHGVAVAGKESQGKYLSECKVKKASGFVESEEGMRVAEEVWREVRGVVEELKVGGGDVW